METLKVLYFAAVGAYVLFCIVRRRVQLNWILILALVVIHAVYFFGREGIALLLFIAVISTAAELMSLKTPFNVFGVTYRYNLSSEFFRSRKVLAGVYPVEITGAWVLFKYVSFFLTAVMLFPFGTPPILRTLVCALMLVSFDFLCDPYAVSKGTWTWAKGGRFFGIPWQNFLGWFLVGLATSLPFMYLEPRTVHEPGMILAALSVCVLTILVTSIRLFALDIKKAILAMAPLTLFVVWGLYTVFL